MVKVQTASGTLQTLAFNNPVVIYDVKAKTSGSAVNYNIDRDYSWVENTFYKCVIVQINFATFKGYDKILFPSNYTAQQIIAELDPLLSANNRKASGSGQGENHVFGVSWDSMPSELKEQFEEDFEIISYITGEQPGLCAGTMIFVAVGILITLAGLFVGTVI